MHILYIIYIYMYILYIIHYIRIYKIYYYVSYICMPLGIKMVAECLHDKITLVFVFLPQEGGRNSKCFANQNAGGQVMGELVVICYARTPTNNSVSSGPK